MSKFSSIEGLAAQLQQMIGELIDAIARWVTQLVLVVLQGTGV